MRDFYTHWHYSTFYMLTFSYRAYIGFIGYLYAYTPTGKEKEGNISNSRKEKKRGTEERSIK